MATVSVVINTYNEESNLDRCLRSVKAIADEIIVVDMHSTDKTIELARKYTDKIFFYEYTRYVEPARNFALSQASGEWILVIDADEELTDTLAAKLKDIAHDSQVDYVEIPRKNLIFGKWIEHSRWWPDYNIRFFRRGKVKYSDKIHQPPQVEGEGKKLDQSEQLALNHYNYSSISQFVERLNRYSDIQSGNLVSENYQFKWQDIILKPSGEFFSRYYSGEGYKDGLHGLVLALLQSFSELIVYLKVWEKQGFVKEQVEHEDNLITSQFNDFLHWRIVRTNKLSTKLLLKIKRRI